MQVPSKLYAFVLMPFSKDFDDIYKLVIKPACDENGVYCERVDETHVLGSIYDKIVNAITKADIIIADLTGRNLNVYYETGYAHALGKVTIHLCRDIKELPFDLQGFQHIVYSPGRFAELKEKLGGKVRWACDYVRTKGKEIGTLSFEFYHKGKKIEDEVSSDIQTRYRADGTVGQMSTSFTLDIFNAGATESQTLGPVYVYTGPSVISVSSETDFKFQSMPLPAPSDDPSFSFRHKLEFRQTLAASEWISLPIPMFFREDLELGNVNTLSVPLKLRFLTESTPLDFFLTLKASLEAVEPTVEIIIGGVAFPKSVRATLVTEFSRDGSVENAGFQIVIGIRNKSSRQKTVGPLHIHTNDLVKKFDSTGLIMGMGLGSTFESSEIKGYSRKFIKSDTSDLDPFAYESVEFSFELEARKLPKNVAKIKVPLLLKLFTPSGPVDCPVVVQTAPGDVDQLV